MVFFSIFSASKPEVVSAAVIPEAISAGLSPGTSEIMKLLTFAGKINFDNCPPFISERCFRTVFISFIGAEFLKRLENILCFSLNSIPFLGLQRSEDPPPDIKQ